MAQRVHESIEVQASLEDVFSDWSNFENLSNFMQNVEEVRMRGQDTSHWTMKGPLGKSVEFDAKTTEMDPSRGIGWNTTEEHDRRRVHDQRRGALRGGLPGQHPRRRNDELLRPARGRRGRGGCERSLQPRAEPQGGPRELRQDRRAGRARRPRRP